MVHVQTPLAALAHTFSLLYGAYSLTAPSGFADFHIRLAPPNQLRSWFRPQIFFFLDDRAPFKPLPISQAFPLFEWGLNWCFANHLNQFLILHAAVLEKGGYAAILPGSPGTGKSTLCAALLHRGWRLLSDEIGLVSLQDGTLAPIPRPISLKNGSIEVVRRFASEAVMGPPAVDTTKGRVVHMQAPQESVARCYENAKPAWLVFPRYDARVAVRFQPYPKASAFMRAAENAFNYARLGVVGFHTLANLVDACSCFELTYGDLARAVDTLNTGTPPSAPVVTYSPT